MEGDFENHELANQFHKLTPEQVLDAVELGGTRCTGRFLALNSYENRVYQLELEDGKFVVGKFYRPGRWDRAAIAEEHSLLHELQELEIPVACPVPLEGGDTIGEVDGILYTLFPRVGGRCPEELNDEQVQILGRLIARIHNVGALKESPARRDLSPQTYGHDNLDLLLDYELIDEDAEEVYTATVEALLQRIEPMFAGVPTHRIHGDCHLGNLLWKPGDPSPIFVDFDDMAIGPAVQDIWMLVPSYDAEGQRQRRLMVEAYREFRDFSDSWLRLVEPLRALRFINYSTWIARRFEDPAFQRTFTHFGTVMYWQREIQDLREQIARIDQESDWGL